MMKTFVTIGVLAVAGLALAGTAAADCEYGNLGLNDYDYYSICTLEYYEYNDPIYSYSSNTPLNAYYYGYGSDSYTNAGAYLSQYNQEICWSNPCSVYDGTNAGLYYYNYDYNTGEWTQFNVYANQYGYESGSFAYDAFDAGASAYVAGENVGANYNQFGYNGGCTEQSYVYGSSIGFESIVAPQDCTLAVTEVPALPHL